MIPSPDQWRGGMNEFATADLTQCYVCGTALPPAGCGHPRFYCSVRCRSRRYELGMPRPVAPHIAVFTLRYVIEPSGCWRWTGHINDAGYGLFSLCGRPRNERWVRAHRWSYEHFVAPIPDGLTLDHLCRNRACVNPAHMEAVTSVENVRRGNSRPSQNARKTHCKHGHPLSGDNVEYLSGGRWRRCKTCSRQRNREYHARKVAARESQEAAA